MTRTDAVRTVIEAWPGTLNSLANAARVPQPTLWRIKNGELGASEDVARAVLDAARNSLRRWSIVGRALDELEAELD